ncbi:hypothetical protein QTP70_014384 [Hemibagrus guttatus]|uniref:Ig-like domain-containing protein n=1 Tax=Hemibagrus guttatus TaxID=175788 RepID=A0AAE0Q690_9TELE|nr:hypothetical protein QTP70_014384 [Hemibagrus guttatus]
MSRCGAVMKTLVFFTFSLHLSSAVTHSLQYFHTGVTPGINFPEFTQVGQVDGQQFVYYDSKIRRMIPKTEWIQRNVGEDYWNSETQTLQYEQEVFKVSVAKAMQRFNHSKGVHTVQRMYGCELDDDGTIRGYDQFSYDGEDFISLDLKTKTWIAPTPQALISKNKWDPNTGATVDYLEKECIEWLKNYVSYDRETMQRKDPPTASVIQKHSPSPEVVCHATGFFPKEVMISWMKDGEDVNEDVEVRETLPNQDGSFQKRSILKVPAEELQKHTYTCVIQHSSLKEELVLEVPKGGGLMAIIVGVVVALVLVAVVAGIMVWKKKNSAIANELSRYGRLVSPIKRIPLGCKSSLVKHLVSFRRMVYMVFKEGKVTPVFLSDRGKKQLSLLWSFPLRPQFGRLWKAPVWLLHQNRQRANPKPSLQPRSPLGPCSVDSGAVLELPALAEVQSCHLEAPVTTPVHGDGGDVEMEDEPTFKVPTKRKKKESGDLLSEPTEIRKQTVRFYSKLYSSERSGAQIVEESFLKDLPKLSEQAARELDRELTLAELHKALQGMENRRAPEHVKGRLSRWKRLVPRMSYRGRTLVINNLAVSSLWHKLACVDPLPNLLASIQALLVDFFWDGLDSSERPAPAQRRRGTGAGPVSQQNCSFPPPVPPETPH